MKVKKILIPVLSVVLCLSIALGIILPILVGISPVANADEMYTVRIEAENAYWNGYQITTNNSVASNTTVIANAARKRSNAFVVFMSYFTFLNLDISSLVPGLFQTICVLVRRRMSQSTVRASEVSSGLGEISRCPALVTV